MPSGPPQCEVLKVPASSLDMNSHRLSRVGTVRVVGPNTRMGNHHALRAAIMSAHSTLEEQVKASIGA